MCDTRLNNKVLSEFTKLKVVMDQKMNGTSNDKIMRT